MNSNHSCSAFFAAVIAAVLMGSLGFFVRESACSAEGCAFARFLIGLVLVAGLLGWQCARGKGSFAFSLPSALSGAGISLCILFYFMAIQNISVGIAALMLYTGPFFAALGEAVLTRRMPFKRDALLMLMSVAGILAVSLCNTGEVQGGFAGIVYGLLSGVCYAAYILLNRQIPQSVSLYQRTFWQFVAGSLLLVVPLLLSDAPYSGLAQGWPYVLCIGLCQGFLVMLLVAYAVRYLTAIQYGSISYLEPAVAVLLGALLYAEVLTPMQWCGFALIITASLLQSLLPRKA